jgi:hypothetical protein
MPRCVHCGDFVLTHPDAIRERPEVFRGFCLKNPGGHEYVTDRDLDMATRLLDSPMLRMSQDPFEDEHDPPMLRMSQDPFEDEHDRAHAVAMFQTAQERGMDLPIVYVAVCMTTADDYTCVVPFQNIEGLVASDQPIGEFLAGVHAIVRRCAKLARRSSSPDVVQEIKIAVDVKMPLVGVVRMGAVFAQTEIAELMTAKDAIGPLLRKIATNEKGVALGGQLRSKDEEKR